MKSFSSLFAILAFLIYSTALVEAKYMVVDAVIKKQNDSYVVLHRSSSNPQDLKDFAKYLEGLKNGSVIGLKLTSRESVPTDQVLIILNSAAKNALIDVLDIRFSFSGKEELNRKIKEELKQLNAWDKKELDLLERPQQNRIPSGETSGWVSSRKRELKTLGVEVTWNAAKRSYELPK